MHDELQASTLLRKILPTTELRIIQVASGRPLVVVREQLHQAHRHRGACGGAFARHGASFCGAVD